ncbi:MAG: ATP-binding cassette domain-containing protein [Candidatus Lokiarchaeota archaeon]|nr:ATP-binding cassette domain-containing protein [Candidatus Lokiarchaeota archaeon]
MDLPIIELKNISADFGNFKLENISLSIKEKEYFVILGPTGAGKTLLLELIAGFHKLKKGKILFNGNDMSKIRSYERNIGFVYQDYSLFPHMDVESNISFGLEIRKIKREEINDRTKEIMQKLGIIHIKDRYPNTLSGGEQQKTALARALITNPRILLLDEPFSALDPVAKKAAIKVVKLIHEQDDLTIIKVTHNQDEAILGDRISLIMNGKIVDTGTPKSIFNHPKSVSNAKFVGIENIFEGIIINNNEGIAEVKFDDNIIYCLSEFNSGKVTIFIRPENIVLSKSLLKSSMRNNLKTNIKEIFSISKELIQVTMSNGLISYITSNAKEDLNLNKGDQIYASFKATGISLKKL